MTIPVVLHVVQGQVGVSADPHVSFTAIIGSCVVVCLNDPEMRVGGMAHFMFPDGAAHGSTEMRFGFRAMSAVITDLTARGAEVGRLQAQLFGGAKTHDGRRNIGKRNAEFALEFLAQQDIPVVGQGLGGDQVKRIRFAPTTGKCTERSLDDGPPHETLATYGEAVER